MSARHFSLGVQILSTIVGAGLLSPVCAESLEVTSAAFMPDRDFSALYPYFHEGWGLRDELGQPKQYTRSVRRGANLHVFVRNTSSQTVTIDSIKLNGLDLAKHLAPRHQEHRGLRAAHFLLNDAKTTPAAARQGLEAAGSPVWWQVRPNPVLAGAFAQATVRLRRIPTAPRLNVEIDGGAATAIDTSQPTVLKIGALRFGAGLRRLYAYARRDEGGAFTLRSVKLDGRSVRPVTPVASRGFLPLDIHLPQALETGSFHHLEVLTKDGQTAAAVARASGPFFALGMWGYRNDGLTLEEMVRDCTSTFRDHLFNIHMSMAGAHTRLLESRNGLKLLSEHGLKLMAGAPSTDNIRSPQLYSRFLVDEPDCSDYRLIKKIPGHLCIGSFAQALAERQREWVSKDARTPTLLNVDMTFKPDNWLTYGQLPDIFALDPYYQNRLRSAYQSHPRLLAQFSQPYYVFAVSEIARSACEPHPLHVILNSTSYRKGEQRFRYGTPEEKRIEFYYSLAAGACGISYWWFTPYGTHHGCGSAEPSAHAMLQAMARLNAEARVLSPLLTRGCRGPVQYVEAQPQWLFARALFAGTDSAVLILINRDHACDRVGTVVQPIPKARVTFYLPPWLKPTSVVRLAEDGPITQAAEIGDHAIKIPLTDVHLTEALVVTERDAILAEMQQGWAGLRPQLDAVEKRTFEEYANARRHAAEQRTHAIELRRKRLFASCEKHAEHLVACTKRLGTYGYETDNIWNPKAAKYNAQTWWVARGKVTPDIVKGLQWQSPRAGRYRVAINYLPGRDYRLHLVSSEGQILTERELPSQFPAHTAVEQWEVEIPEGAVVEFVQLGKDARGEMWGRVSPYAYFVPLRE